MSASHCQLVLDALADGEWHSTASLYRECGGMILHSRIADLRRRGHTIEHRHVGGQGASAHEYRLLAEPSARVVENPAAVATDFSSADWTGTGPDPPWADEQMTLAETSGESSQIDADVHRYGHVAAWR